MYAWKSYFVVQADYQHWANEMLFAALDHLQPEVLASDQGLSFRSIHHAVDHLLAVSQVWQARLRGESPAVNYRVVQHADWRELKTALRRETRRLQTWLETRTETFFDTQIQFVGGDGKARTMWVRDALTHLFTHSAQHRGQISAAATRLGAPCPEIDFVLYKREMERLLSEAPAARAGGG